MLDSTNGGNLSSENPGNENCLTIKEIAMDFKFKVVKGTQGLTSEFEVVKVSDIMVERKYQRYIFESTLKKHLDGQPFNLTLARPPVLYWRPESAGGGYMAIDGQHTAVMAYLTNGPDFTITCEVHYHSEGLTIEQCEAIEAWHFKHLNTDRKNLKPMEVIKAGILYGEPDAVKAEEELTSVGLNIDNVGDTGMFGYPVSNITRVRWAFKQFDLKDLQASSKFLVQVDKQHWQKGRIKDTLFAGMAAVFKLRHHLNGGVKGKGLENWLVDEFPKIKESTWIKNTGGSKGHIYFARRVVDFYNSDYERGKLNFPSSSIGETVMEQVGLQDPDKG